MPSTKLEADAMYRAHVQRANELHAMDSDYASATYCPYVRDWADIVCMFDEYAYWLTKSSVVADAYVRIIEAKLERARKHPLSFVNYVDPFQTDVPCWMR